MDDPASQARGQGLAQAVRHRSHIGRLLLSEAARPLRFAATGGTAGAFQLSLLAWLTRHGWESLLANVTAFLLAAQINFALSCLFTWRDRIAQGTLWRRWAAFHGSVAGMAAVNMLVFAVTRLVLPALLASALGIGVAAIGNFVVGDRLVFRTALAASGADNGQAPAA